MRIKLEYVNSVIAVIAIAASFASPFVAYHWLDPKIQELKHFPKLHYAQEETEDGAKRHYKIRVDNLGDMAATNVRVALEFAPGIEVPNRDNVLISPPVPCKIEFQDRRCRIEIDGGLAGGQPLDVRVEAKVKDPSRLFDDSINTLAKALSGFGFDKGHEPFHGHAVVGMAACDQGYGDTQDRWEPTLKQESEHKK